VRGSARESGAGPGARSRRVREHAQERKVSQLQAALDSRVIIEQAIGILAERFDLSFEEAFEVLRAAARNSRREVRAVVEELRVSRETPLAISDVLPRDPNPLLSSAVEPADLRCPRCGTTIITY